MSDWEDSAPRFSVVLCTRNPRPDYLARVLAAIEGQGGDISRELVVVDSSSTPALSDRAIRWPPGTRLVRVDEPGVARARVAGVHAVRGEWIVFVDDDNVLDDDYLQRAAEVIERHPGISLFCGRISGEFESPPPSWLTRFHRQLAIIDVAEDTWANEWDPARVPYWTAGMCVRRDVVAAHCDEVNADPFAVTMTRVEDVYLVMRTVAKGHMAGIFRALHLRHLVPPERMTPRYLCKIVRETAYTMTILRCRNGGATLRDILRPTKQAAVATVRHGWSATGRIARAAARGDFEGAMRSLLGQRPRTPSCGGRKQQWN